MRALFLDVYLLLLNTRRGRVGKGRLWPLFTADGLGGGKEYVFQSVKATERRSHIKAINIYLI